AVRAAQPAPHDGRHAPEGCPEGRHERRHEGVVVPMDKRLQILQALYAEGDDREQAHRLLQEDPALWEEYQALSEAKFHLDHRRRQRPDPLVLDAILAAASGEAPAVGLGRRPDRRPIPRGALRFRSFGVVTVVLVMVMLAGAGVWQVLQPNGS